MPWRLGLVAVLPPNNLLRWVGYLLVAGIVLFSGSLYLLAIFNIDLAGHDYTLWRCCLFIGMGFAGLSRLCKNKSGVNHGKTAYSPLCSIAQLASTRPRATGRSCAI